MTAVHARVLLDTGPNDVELRRIRALFADAGLTADVEGHSYGGPPPTSMFLIVVNVPLLGLLDRFAAEGAARLETLLRSLLLIRADARRWGRPHVLKLEDAHGRLSIICPPELPAEAYAGLLRLDLSTFDRGSPSISCAWHAESTRWLGRVDAGRQVWRALPARLRAGPSDAARQLAPAEFGELWRLVQSPETPLVTWQRANVVALSALGWNVASIAAKTLLSPDRIRRNLAGFNRDGFSALSSGYHAGQPEPSAEALDAARRIAATPPARLGVQATAWDPRTLGEFLVGRAIVEDVSDGWVLETLLAPQPAVA
ncbi:MAG TPA: hypothetical protein VGP31_08415 [Planosporangium sp.]|nr:hypothetical protein [Planosporangium sp.]